MEKEPLQTKPTLRKDKKSPDASLVIFDLPTLIERMKHKQSWVVGELNAMILLKSPKKQIVLTAMHEGTEIKSFQSNDSITFQIIEGKVMIHTRKQTIILDKGQLMTLHENIKYKLKTKEETVLLLTIANSTMQSTES